MSTPPPNHAVPTHSSKPKQQPTNSKPSKWVCKQSSISSLIDPFIGRGEADEAPDTHASAVRREVGPVHGPLMSLSSIYRYHRVNGIIIIITSAHHHHHACAKESSEPPLDAHAHVWSQGIFSIVVNGVSASFLVYVCAYVCMSL